MKRILLRVYTLFFLALAAMLLAIPTSSAKAQSRDEKSPSPVYQKAKAAAVEVLLNGHLNGTGWFVDPKGVLFTAAHVLERPGQKVEVTSPTIGRVPAEVLAVDLGHDLALLKISVRSEPYPALALAEKPCEPGEDVFLFGAPIYRHAVLIRGTAARDDTTFEYYEGRYNEVTHISATVPVGMSGGPWLNSRGEVVGLNSGVMSLNGLPVGVAFAAPLSAVRRLATSRRSAATPSLGAAIEELWQQDAKAIGRFPPQTEGLMVAILEDGGPAARSGIKQGELITAADESKVRLSEELLRLIAKKSPGQPIDVRVLSPDGTGERTATVTLGKLEINWP
jgi:S1-C subfamily serine protease